MIARCVCGAVEYRPLNASSMTVACERRKVERPWAHNLLKILGSEVPRSTAVLCFLASFVDMISSPPE